jgi:hypothetical protein
LPANNVKPFFNKLASRFLLYLQNIVAISRLSLPLSLLLLLLLVQLSVSGVLKFFMKQILAFFWSGLIALLFELKLVRLKVSKKEEVPSLALFYESLLFHELLLDFLGVFFCLES